MFGKTWGLQPHVAYWIYTAVVRHIITYDSMLWCLGITGAMRTSPTAALEILLGLPSLQLQLEEEARAGIYRLQCSDQ
jgi:hypothetical protein